MRSVLVTGSSGLVGSAAVAHFAGLGSRVVGVDNDARRYFFGAEASTAHTARRLREEYPHYLHINADIRDQRKMDALFEEHRFALVFHAAAQPSHEWAAREPLTDFSINAVGTLILLEATRRRAPDAVFLYLSTNKVYGDHPNTLPLQEQETRFDLPEGHPLWNGVPESMSVDRATHSLFGVSKTAADLMVQEYARTCGLCTGVFRAGCITGSAHAPAEQHGFLAYLVKRLAFRMPYVVIGYGGKQVRDMMHASDLVRLCACFAERPCAGRVYNVGGGRRASVSVQEALAAVGNRLNVRSVVEERDEPRLGDHRWYITDMTAFRREYPSWESTYTLDMIFDELCEFWARQAHAAAHSASGTR